MTTGDTMTIIDQLNEWQKNYDPQNWDGANIWEDVIYTLPGYDDAATDRIEHGTGDRFVADGRVYRYHPAKGEWVDDGEYEA